jgi:hypothetical protein
MHGKTHGTHKKVEEFFAASQLFVHEMEFVWRELDSFIYIQCSFSEL